MISKYTYKGLTWIDLESPTEEELLHVMEEYSIPVLVSEELHNRSPQSRIDLFPNFIYLIMHFPRVSHHRNKGVEQEIDFIVGNKFIITTHYEFIEPLHEFSKTFEVDAILEKRMDIDHAGFLFYHLIKTLYAHSRYELNDMNSLLRETEKNIFDGQESKMVITISNINRTLIDFRQALRFHKEALNQFEFVAKKFFGDGFSYYLTSIISEYTKTEDILDSHKEILDDLRDTNDSLLASKSTQTITLLTLITFLTSPIILISSIFVMDTRFVKEQPTEFYSIIGVMIALSILAFVYSKYKKWL